MDVLIVGISKTPRRISSPNCAKPTVNTVCPIWRSGGRRRAGLRERYPAGWEEVDDGPARAAACHFPSRETVGSDNTIYVTGVGQHQMWANQFLNFEHPRQWLSSRCGDHGFGVPAAMGAKVGQPDKTVWVINRRDGSFQMTNQELATCCPRGSISRSASSPSLGMVRQWQSLFLWRTLFAYGSQYRSWNAPHT